METATLIHVYPNRVWIEDDFCGSKHVVIQSEAPGCQPFTYCSFFYDYAYTSNSTVWQMAEKIAISLGATEPVERRLRKLPNFDATPASGGPRDG